MHVLQRPVEITVKSRNSVVLRFIRPLLINEVNLMQFGGQQASVEIGNACPHSYSAPRTKVI
jgi:hypothetical protein